MEYIWIIIVVQFLVFMPLPLFLAGKLMKLPIKYLTALWITFFASIVAGLITLFTLAISPIISLLVFIAVLYYEINGRYHPKPQTTLIVIFIDIVVLLGLEFVKPFLLVLL